MTKSQEFVYNIKSNKCCSTCHWQKSCSTTFWKPRCSHNKIANFLKDKQTPLLGRFLLCPLSPILS